MTLHKHNKPILKVTSYQEHCSIVTYFAALGDWYAWCVGRALADSMKAREN